MTKNFKGTVCGIAGAMAYGTNPLFSLPLFKMGVDLESVLFFVTQERRWFSELFLS